MKMAFGLSSRMTSIHCSIVADGPQCCRFTCAGNEAILSSFLGALKGAWLACMDPFGRMEWKLRAQALESDSPRSESQNGH